MYRIERKEVVLHTSLLIVSIPAYILRDAVQAARVVIEICRNSDST